MLSRAVALGDKDETRELFNRALEATMFLGLPAAAALIVLADPIMQVLFVRGAFTSTDAHMTALVLQGYCVGLPAYIAVKVFSTAFWSRQDTKTPVKVSIICTLTNIVLALSFVQFMGVPGIALATGLVGWLQIVLLARPLKGHESLHLDDRFKLVVPRMVLATVLMVMGIYTLNIAMQPHLAMDGMMKYIALSILIGAGMSIYALASIGTKAINLSDLKKFFVKRKV
jgi:putative peptidoglycan lipid II flippase